MGCYAGLFVFLTCCGVVFAGVCYCISFIDVGSIVSGCCLLGLGLLRHALVSLWWICVMNSLLSVCLEVWVFVLI